MRKPIIATLTTLSIMFLTLSVITAQQEMNHDKMNDAAIKSCCSTADKVKNSCMDKNTSHDMQSIDIKKIDKNKDGKVYQCPMCADQLADEHGKCSKCEMELKEVSTEEAQKALSEKNHSMMEHGKMDDHKMDHSKMMNHKEYAKLGTKKETIVREGKIDLVAIDKNGDGKVFQDLMDWNVISDKAGRCPICDMKLKEVTLEQAKKNLVGYGFEVVEN